jgi:hypothetical protein
MSSLNAEACAVALVLAHAVSIGAPRAPKPRAQALRLARAFENHCEQNKVFNKNQKMISGDEYTDHL